MRVFKNSIIIAKLSKKLWMRVTNFERDLKMYYFLEQSQGLG